MALFSYRARNLAGQLVTGRVEAADPPEAVALLRARGLFVVKLQPQRTLNPDWDRFFRRKIGSRDLAVFCRQLATMIESGVPLLESLKALIRQTGNRKLVEVLRQVTAEIEKGKSLSEAFRNFQDCFPGFFINMLVAGEVSSTLDQAMDRLAETFEKSYELSSKVKAAMAYPLLVAGFSLLAVIGLMVAVVPMFAEMFQEAGSALPLPTRVLLGISRSLQSCWYFYLSLPLLLLVAVTRAVKTPGGRLLADTLALKVPVMGALLTRAVVSRFARILSTLLKSGVPLLLSLETVENTLGNAAAAREISQARSGIREGGGLALALANSKFFSPMALSMIAIGEETGSLDLLLDRLASYYEQDVEAMIARLSSLLEPLLITGVGLLVAFIALSIYLPLFGLSGTIQGGGISGTMP